MGTQVLSRKFNFWFEILKHWSMAKCYFHSKVPEENGASLQWLTPHIAFHM